MDKVIWGNENPDGPEPCLGGCTCSKCELNRNKEFCECGNYLLEGQAYCEECI